MVSASNSSKKSKQKIRVTEYERLGRSLGSIFEGGYINHFRVYKINFIRGLFFGFGVAIGGTIVVAMLLWFLSLFAEIPILGEFTDTVSETIDR